MFKKTLEFKQDIFLCYGRQKTFKLQLLIPMATTRNLDFVYCKNQSKRPPFWSFYPLVQFGAIWTSQFQHSLFDLCIFHQGFNGHFDQSKSPIVNLTTSQLSHQVLQFDLCNVSSLCYIFEGDMASYVAKGR